MKRSTVPILFGLTAGLLLAAGIFFTRPYQLHGSVIAPPQPAPEIALGDFRLEQQAGNVVLVFFGYTSCPDVCPTTLGEMKTVLTKLGSQAEKVSVVFITVDPKRDTPERAQAYAAAFHPRIIGLSGTTAELEPIWQAYGVFRAERPGSTDDVYSVDHSARTYLIDPQGNLHVTYAYGTPVQDLVSDIKSFLK